MKNLNLSLNNIIFYIKIKIHLFIILISLISLLIIFLGMINFNIFTGLSQIIFFDWIFNFSVFCSTIFTLLFLPIYPIIFILAKNRNLNFLERLTITIVTNLSFYTIIGILGFYLGFAITEWFFFTILVLSYFLFILLSIIFNLKKGESPIFRLKFTHDYKENFRIF